MPPLRRHQLAHPTPSGWRAVLAHAWDDEARDCLHHWATRGLPLVVTRQRVPLTAQTPPIALGLCAPRTWGRRLLALQLPLEEIGWFSEFPLLAQVLHELPREARAPLQALHHTLAAGGLRAHAYGSAGWQQLTGLRYLHAASDLDLWIGVETVEAADQAVSALTRHAPAALRVDGELVFLDGSAVAWREWCAWREGRSRGLLVKRLHGVAIERAPSVEPEQMPWPCAA
jgi:phosphoribosyl-dephospho-CoA transferase